MKISEVNINDSFYCGDAAGRDKDFAASDLMFANNLGMAGVGISNGSYWHLNNQNPAALTSNIFTTFEMGLSSDLRQV